MTTVERLHGSGKKVTSYPFRFYLLPATDATGAEETAIRVISIPKKLFKRAVRRNLLRRRTREALRHLAPEFPDLEKHHILIVYIAPQILDYRIIKEGLKNALGKIL